MTDHNDTCAERISSHLEGRADDVRKMLAAYRGETVEHFHAGHNIPGYMPMDDDPPIFDSFEGAKAYIIEELDRAGDALMSSDEEDERALADEYSAAMEDLNLDDGPEWGETLPSSTSEYDLGIAYWITSCNEECEVEDPEYTEDSLGEFGLSLEREVAFKFLMSTGGPADWLEITCDEETHTNGDGWDRSAIYRTYDIERVTYHFADWWDHAEQVVTDGPLFELAEWIVEGQS